jgi:hypothetical protein
MHENHRLGLPRRARLSAISIPALAAKAQEARVATLSFSLPTPLPPLRQLHTYSLRLGVLDCLVKS